MRFAGGKLSRRHFLGMAAAALPAPALAGAPLAPQQPVGRFPKDFLWGASTSALQIEGSLKADGRGTSIWETFAATPGAIADGSTPEPACDHYRRWAEDVALMRAADFNAYRFSIAWPRVMPEGTGSINAKGLDFYDRLVDALLGAGIRPMPCLYHWDLPQPLQDRGGWMSRDMAGWFADYSRAVAARLGDRVADWFTLNEPSVVAIFGYGLGSHAPGLKGGKDGVLAALHHQNLAQGAALRALRAEGSHFRLGTVLSLQPVNTLGEREEDRAAARHWDALWNRVPLDGVMRGRLPDLLAADLGRWVKPGDLEAIHFPLDRLGINYYSPFFAHYTPGGLYDAGLGAPQGTPVTAMGWPVVPEGLFEMLAEIRDHYGNPEVMITENGAAYDDHPGADGRVDDKERIAYLSDHLRQVGRAIAAGCRVKGYLAWSLLDNWEWQFGYARRFGLVYVDYPSQRRLPKDSLAWYKGLVEANRQA